MIILIRFMCQKQLYLQENKHEWACTFSTSFEHQSAHRRICTWQAFFYLFHVDSHPNQPHFPFPRAATEGILIVIQIAYS